MCFEIFFMTNNYRNRVRGFRSREDFAPMDKGYSIKMEAIEAYFRLSKLERLRKKLSNAGCVSLMLMWVCALPSFTVLSSPVDTLRSFLLISMFVLLGIGVAFLISADLLREV